MKNSKKLRKVLSMFLAFLMFCSVTLTDMALMTSKTKAEAAMNQYGLLDKACDGLILHCWNWSYSNIKSSMADIAAAGYTSLQTSPVQMPKDAGSDNQGNWWKVYQPTTLSMVENHPWFGSKSDFKAMCDEAEKYGIKVIVDIVANHMANNTGSQGNCRADICSQNDPTFRDDDSCWHLNGSKGIDYGNQHRNGDTSSLTHGFGGWPDLNTGNKKVQNAIISLLKECVDLGADGFRFDAAKHIELPTDPGGASDFWPTVTSAIRNYKSDVYLYGEILDDSATSISNYTKYLAVTDNRAGNSTRYGVRENNIGKAANSSLTYDGQLGDNIVLWSESHDTYANDNFTGESAKFSQDQINRAWCIIAARDFAALYYIRPGSTGAAMGSKSTNTAWKDTEIVAVNKFHNYFNGTSEYMSSCDNSVVLVERGSKTATGGVVLVNIGGGSKSVSGATTHLLADGTYKDQVSGSTFTVSGGKISGQIGNTGVAVVYNAEPIVLTPTPTISKEGGEFSTDTLALTIGLSNATSGTYKIGSGSATTYTSSKSITIGSDMSIGDSVTITLTATDGSKTTTKTYTFTKTEYIEPQGNIAYLKLPSGWSAPVKCYAYDSATETVNNGVWPGQEMTLDSETGYYKYEVPSSIKKPRVIFYSSDVNRYPANKEKGLLFEEECPYLYKDGSWSKYSPTPTTGTVVVKYVDGANNEIATSKTTKGTIGSSYTTTAATIDGYTLKTTPNNATGKYTAGTITVTYVYEEIPDTDPKVTTSLASGSTFKTETQTITLTLANATSGTYSVDDGPVKTFTNTASVVLGQGKVADSTVTVKATATGATGTKTFTFTYNKQFNGTVNEQTNATTTSTTSSQGLASQYTTNPNNGVGVKKTISVDGSLSDWDSSMLIAQGAANDDPRVYRDNSMYEIPIDLYALYGAYDDKNLYLMWEMTNVQDVVAPNDNYPLSQGVLWQTQELPFFILVDTGDSSTAIGNNAELTTGGTIWNSGMTVKNSFNKLISINTKGGNGPWVYGGDSSGLNPVEELDASTSGVKMNFGLGKLSTTVTGINGAYGHWNDRLVGDVCDDSADWVDFNTLGHSSSTMDFFYEVSIPFEDLGVTSSQVASKGLGVLLVATMGKSGMDCLPYDVSMNDNADQADTESQKFNSFEKSDEDYITTPFARLVNGAPDPIPEELVLNFGAEKSSPQSAGTALTLKGIAQGGTAPYTYKYYVGSTLLDTKSGSGETTTTWTPSAAGKYLIKCVVTDAAGTSVTSAKYYNIESGVTPPPNPVLTASAKASATNVAVGGTVTFTATATGGTAPYKYSYIVFNETTNSWARLVDKSSSNTFAWTAGSAGKRIFYVDVTDATGKTVRCNELTVVTGGNSELKASATASATNVAIGQSVTFKATATGGSAPYKYSFIVHNETENSWYRFVDKSTSNTFTWTAGRAGTRIFYVDVTDSTGKTVRCDAIKVVTGGSTNKLSVMGSATNFNPSVGSTTTIIGLASGGTGSYTYSFVVYNQATGTWYRYAFGTSSVLNWTASSAGTREFYVEAKDSAGTVIRSSAVVITVK